MALLQHFFEDVVDSKRVFVLDYVQSLVNIPHVDEPVSVVVYC